MVRRRTLAKIRWGPFFAKYGQVDEVGAVISKSGIATGDIVLQVSLTRHSSVEIPNLLMCREKRMLVVVEGRHPFCWTCGASGHMSTACPRKKVAAQPQANTTAAATITVAATEVSGRR